MLFRSWGVLGGKPGKPGRVSVFRKEGGEPEIYYKHEGIALTPGDEVRIEAGGGGGYGAPSERALDSIALDLKRGYVSAEAATRDYGVRITADGEVTR